jgi:diguanylate cyclase (GGDEF)-like protein/PAS domain S-box-containing protein
MTELDTPSAIGRAEEIDPYGLVVKPPTPAGLHSAIEIALHRHRVERRLEERERRYRMLVEASPTGIARSTREGQILEANPAFARILGFSQEDITGVSMRGLFRSSEEFERIRERLHGPGQAFVGEVGMCRDDGATSTVLYSACLIDDDRSDQQFVISTTHDIGDQLELASKLQAMAYTDSLTQMPNRRMLERQAAQILALADRQSAKVGLLYLDISGFKRVNDSLGHPAGDELLERAADRIRKAARDSDFVARIGGDEFAVLLSEVTGVAESQQAAWRLVEAFDEPFPVAGESIGVDLRVGVALYPDHATDFDGLLGAADSAMQHVHERKGVGVYDLEDEGLDDEFVASLSEGFERGDLELAFQAIFSIRQKLAVGAEALVRWRHPERGLLTAAELLPALRRRGLFPSVDRWVMREAARWLRSRASELGVDWVAVNLDAATLTESPIEEWAPAVLDEERVEAPRVRLELGSLPTNGGSRWRDSLGRLGEQGFCIGLDGPATNLDHDVVRQIHYLKLDGRYVQNIGRSQSRAALASALLATSRATGLEVLVNRVDSEEQYEWARKNGIEYFQGFMWARPRSAEEFSPLPDPGGFATGQPSPPVM